MNKSQLKVIEVRAQVLKELQNYEQGTNLCNLARKVSIKNKTAWRHLIALEKEGKVVRKRYKQKGQVGSIPTTWIGVLPTKETHSQNKSSIGVSDEDLAWMRYWKLPRSERLLKSAPPRIPYE